MSRLFYWSRQEVAEHCTVEVNHVHICITTPGYRLIRPSCNQKFINFRFLDIPPETIRATELYKADLVKGNERLNECFSQDQAREMAEFVKSTTDHILVNCEAGISRSPGVVLALRRVFGGDVEEVFERARPNLYVAYLLETELR